MLFLCYILSRKDGANMDIYQRIKILRLQNNLSQDDLAKKCGYKNRQMISRIESGLVDLPLSKVEKIAHALNVAPVYLAGFSKNQKNMDDALELSSLIEKAAQLDDADRARIAERIEILLENNKYQGEENGMD